MAFLLLKFDSKSHESIQNHCFQLISMRHDLANTYIESTQLYVMLPSPDVSYQAK